MKVQGKMNEVIYLIFVSRLVRVNGFLKRLRSRWVDTERSLMQVARGL